MTYRRKKEKDLEVLKLQYSELRTGKLNLDCYSRFLNILQWVSSDPRDKNRRCTEWVYPDYTYRFLSPNCHEIGPYLYLFTEVVDEEYVEETVEFFMKEEVEPASKE